MRSSTRNLLTLSVLAAALLLGGAGAAHAKDLCVRRQDGTILAILRGFKAPVTNKCRAVNGTHANGMLYGTVCRTADGQTLRFGTTTNVGAALFSPPKVRQHSFYLAYPTYDSGAGSEFTTDAGPPITTTETTLPPLYGEYCSLDVQ